MGTFHTRRTSHQPSILVGWAAGVLQTWPDEAPDSYEVRRPRQASTPDEILAILAAALHVPGDLTPTAVLDVLERGARPGEPTMDDRQSVLALMLVA